MDDDVFSYSDYINNSNNFSYIKYVFTNNYNLVDYCASNRINHSNFLFNFFFFYDTLCAPCFNIVTDYNYSQDLECVFDYKIPNSIIVYGTNILTDFSNFKIKNLNILFRFNINNSKILSGFEKIYNFFSMYHVSYKYLFDLSINFTVLLFSKDVVKFCYFLSTLVQSLNRVEQKGLFAALSCFGVFLMNRLMRRFRVFGLYMKFIGKVAGYVGDRKRSYIINYGSISRSKRNYKYNYMQTTANTDAGVIGIKTILVFN